MSAPSWGCAVAYPRDDEIILTTEFKAVGAVNPLATKVHIKNVAESCQLRGWAAACHDFVSGSVQGPYAYVNQFKAWLALIGPLGTFRVTFERETWGRYYTRDPGFDIALPNEQEVRAIMRYVRSTIMIENTRTFRGTHPKRHIPIAKPAGNRAGDIPIYTPTWSARRPTRYGLEIKPVR